MTNDHEPKWTISVVWQGVKKIVGWIFWVRWAIVIGLTTAALLWQAYILGKNVSNILTEDYNKVQSSQKVLIDYAQDFHRSFLNPIVDISINSDPNILGKKAGNTVSVLGNMRTFSNQIENEKYEYRIALEELIGVSNRLSRGEMDNMVIPLHNALQNVANKAGDLNVEVSRFQGSMWQQLINSP